MLIILTGYTSGISARSLFITLMGVTFAGAIDMGLLDYVSEKADISYIQSEYEREMYEV